MANDGTITLAEDTITNRHVKTTAAIAQSKLAQRVLAPIAIPLTDWRTWDNLAVNLPGTPGSDDIGLVTGTWGSDAPYLSSGDLKAANTTRYAGCFVALPNDYEAAQTVQLNLIAGMTTTVSDTTATADLEVWRLDEDGTLGAADLCATAALSINSLTPADKTFTVTATTLEAGDILYVRLALHVQDAATGTAVIASVWKTELWADLR